MNRDELLEKLAMELAEWPSSFGHIKPWGDTWRGYNHLAFPDSDGISEEEWLAERERLMNSQDTLTTSLGASGWDEDRIDIIGSNGATGEHYSSEPVCSCGSVVGEYHNPECAEVNAFQAGRINSADEAPAWNGEGLPPVGANCLMQSHILGMWANEWLEVEVLAHKPPLMIGWCEEKQIAIWSDACRPIRTKEDEAVEHMKSVAGTSYVRPEHMEMITRALYRAGYRKLEVANE